MNIDQTEFNIAVDKILAKLTNEEIEVLSNYFSNKKDENQSKRCINGIASYYNNRNNNISSSSI